MQHDYLCSHVRSQDHQDDTGSPINILSTRNILDAPEPATLPLERLTGSTLLSPGRHLDLQLAYCGHEPGLHDISVLLVFRKVSYRIDLVFSVPAPRTPSSLPPIITLGLRGYYSSIGRCTFRFISGAGERAERFFSPFPPKYGHQDRGLRAASRLVTGPLAHVSSFLCIQEEDETFYTARIRIPFHVEPLLQVAARVGPSAYVSSCTYSLAVEVWYLVNTITITAVNMASDLTGREHWGVASADLSAFYCWTCLGDVGACFY